MQAVAELFLEFTLLGCMAFGGVSALIPEMHRVVVEHHHWLSDATFVNLCAIGQAAPGPNVLVVTLIGWEVAGPTGALASTLGLCWPMSAVVFVLFRHWDRFRGVRWQQAVQIGVAPLAVGLIFSAGYFVGSTALLGASGWVFALTVAAANVGLRTLHPLWLIAAGALVGGLGIV